MSADFADAGFDVCRLQLVNGQLKYHPRFRVFTCVPCGVAFQPQGLLEHVKLRHVSEFTSPLEMQRYVRLFKGLDLASADEIQGWPEPSPTDPPLPFLQLHQSLRCRICGPSQAYICSGRSPMIRHHGTVYKLAGILSFLLPNQRIACEQGLGFRSHRSDRHS
jgi:hypothetical protein